MSSPTQYRKKQIVIEAMLWDGNNYVDIVKWAGGDNIMPGGDAPVTEPDWKLAINTLEGTMTAEVGDYIIKGVKGEFYPCKPDIFKLTYEEFYEN